MVVVFNGVKSHLPPGSSSTICAWYLRQRWDKNSRVIGTPRLRLPKVVGAVLGLAPRAYGPVVLFAHFFHIYAA